MVNYHWGVIGIAAFALVGCGAGDQESASEAGTLETTTAGPTTDPTDSTGPTDSNSITDTSSETDSSGSDSASMTNSSMTDPTTVGPTDSESDPTTQPTETDPTTSETDSQTDTDGECHDPECCEPEEAFCDDICCPAGDVCSFKECVTPGDECEESSDCNEGAYCELTLGEPEMMPPDPMCMGGVMVPNGKCLPKPPLCGPNDPPQDPNDPECLQSCEYQPTENISVEVKYAWGGKITPPYDTDIMMAPIVIQLDDDDCDGKVTERDIPEIVFSTFNGSYDNFGTLHAISIVDGMVIDKWAVPNMLNATKQLAAGNIDGIPGNEVVGCGQDGSPRAFSGDGSLLWTAPTTACVMPSIADLDADGSPEVIVEGAILNGADGSIKAMFSEPLATSFVVSDLDDDGELDIVTGSQGFHADGTLFVDTGLANQTSFPNDPDWKSPWPAVADFDGDLNPEVVVIDNLNHALSMWRYDENMPGNFEVVRSPVDINGPLSPSLCPNGSWGNTHGGGPPTIADFDGDGTPDVGTAGGVGYAVFSGALLMDDQVAGPDTLLWINPTTDCSSASTGSSVFDFDGDGKAEVVYSDQLYLRVYDGTTGSTLVERCNTTATLIEYPLVADVDNDGQADIVVISNAYSQTCIEGNVNKQAGVRVFGPTSGQWVRTRRVWNQHAYHVTNIDESGEVPTAEIANWQVPGLNNFRQNKQPDSELGAPDAIVAIAPFCDVDDGYSLVATVRNVGEAVLPPGVVVGFYIGDPPDGTKVGESMTTTALYPLEAETLVLPYDDAPQDVKDGVINIYAVVDDTMQPHPEWQECRTDNNTGVNSGKCLSVE